jgi:hypothetical protein
MKTASHSSAEHIYSIADNHVQTVQVCIDRLHKLGANEQLKLLTQGCRSWPSRRHGETMTKAPRPLSANGDGLSI